MSRRSLKTYGETLYSDSNNELNNRYKYGVRIDLSLKRRISCHTLLKVCATSKNKIHKLEYDLFDIMEEDKIEINILL